jgi:signal transduction histidine kinase
VLKHAQAQHVAVHLHFTAETVSLEVNDDGVGFDLQKVRSEAQGGVGLRSIAERTARIGGRLTLESQPGAGTRLRDEVLL